MAGNETDRFEVGDRVRFNLGENAGREATVIVKNPPKMLQLGAHGVVVQLDAPLADGRVQFFCAGSVLSLVGEDDGSK